MDSSGGIDRLPSIPLWTMVVGIIAGILLHGLLSSIYIFGGLVVAVAVLGLARCYRITAVIVGVALGWLAAYLDEPRQFDILPDKSVVYEGVVDDVRYKADRANMLVDVDSRLIADTIIPVEKFRVSVSLGNPPVDLQPGDILRFKGIFSYPEIKKDLPTDNDLKEYYRNHGVSLTCLIVDTCYTVTGRTGNWIYALQRFRNKLSDRLAETTLDPETEAFMSAILLGDTSDLDQDLRQRYAVAGVAHVLALSGAHLAIIAVIVNLLLSPMALAGYKRSRWWIAAGILWAYVVMTGMSPSVVRSAVMVTAVFLGSSLDRPRSAVNSLCFAAILILLVTPRALWMAGFQFSFVATLSIVLFVGRLNPSRHRSPFMRFILNWLLVTFAATIATMPLMAWHFHQIPLYFLPANLLAVFMLPVAIFGGLLLLLLLAVGIPCGWLEWCINKIYGVFSWVVDLVNHIPGGTIDEVYFPAWILIPIYLTLGIVLLWVYRRRRVYAVAAAVLLLFTGGAYWLCRPQYPEEEVFIYGKSAYTNIWMHHGDTVTVLTSARSFDVKVDSLEWRDRHREFFGSRHIREFKIIARPQNCIVTIDSLTYKFSLDTIAAPYRTTYCIIDRNTPGNAEEIIEFTPADTFLLSPYLNHLRSAKFSTLAPTKSL